MREHMLFALNELVGGWVQTRDALALAYDDYSEGRAHAYIEALENYDDLAMFSGETELEAQIDELIHKCEVVPTAYTKYGEGYRVGMSEVADDLRTMRNLIFS